MRIVFLLFSHVLLYSFTPIFAQNEVDLLLNSFQSTDTLPSGILSEKTVVLIHTGDGSPQEFNRISEIVHANFLKAGIDAVSYYDILDLYAGKDVTRGFALYFRKREIENIIIVDYKGDDSRIFATVPDYKSDILVEGQSVWMRSGKVNEISSRLYISAANSGIERENFLINDIPEPGLLVNPINGKRSEFFSLNLGSAKLAVPLYKDPSKNAQLKKIIEENYPYTNFDFVDPDITEVELLEQKYSYILEYITSTGTKVHEFLEYEIKEGVSSFATVTFSGGKQTINPIPKAQVVYKYYIKNLRSGDVYLGTEWDAGISWEQAIINHFGVMKKELDL